MSRSKPENVDRRRTWLLASAVMLLAIHGPATQSHARAEAFQSQPRVPEMSAANPGAEVLGSEPR